MGKRTGKPRGRPKGAQSQFTRERAERVQAAADRIVANLPDAFEGDSHELLMLVYKDQSQPWPVRIDAAKAAIGYEKPRLAAVEVSADVRVSHEDALSELERATAIASADVIAN